MNPPCKRKLQNRPSFLRISMSVNEMPFNPLAMFGGKTSLAENCNGRDVFCSRVD
jgi:hypothetical protein